MCHRHDIIAACLGNIGLLYTATGKFTEAEKYLDSALTIDIEMGVLDGQKHRHEALSHLYDTLARKRITLTGFGTLSELWRKAYDHYKKYSAAKDSLFNEEKSKEIGRLEAGHEYEKQMLEQRKEHEKQQALSEAELKRQRIIAWSFTGGFGLVLLLAFVIYRSYRQKKKANLLLEEKNTIIEEKNKDITDSITYARRIQHAKLPKKEEIYSILPDSFVLFKPKDIVSGDFYWLGQKDGQTILAACDCTGHGVPGAFMSMIGSEKLDEAVSRSAAPSEILQQLNKGIKTLLHQSESAESTRDGMDIALCSVDTANRKVWYAGANRPLWLIRKWEPEVEEIKPTRTEGKKGRS